LCGPSCDADITKIKTIPKWRLESQDRENQLAKLKGEGCGVIRSEEISGASRDGRNELAQSSNFFGLATSLLLLALTD
jgi:hypothetical protein